MSKKTIKFITLMLIMVLAVVTLTGCSMNPTNDEGTGAGSTENLAVYTQDEDMEGYTKCEEIEGIEFYYPSNYVSVGKDNQPMYQGNLIILQKYYKLPYSYI